MPLIIMALRYTDRNEAKRQYEQTYHIELEGFWKKEVVAVIAYGNPWALTFMGLLVIGLCLVMTVSFGCSYVIYRTITTNESRISVQMKRDSRRMLLALIVLVRNNITLLKLTRSFG